MATLNGQSFRTPIFKLGQSLVDFVVAHIPRSAVGERSVVAITSKLVSLAEHRVRPRLSTSKRALIHAEADRDLGPIAHGSILTIKHGLFVIAAGIDESNSASGDYILYPLHPWASAEGLWRELRARWHIHELGVILTDSRTSPLRRGVTGVSLAHHGFDGVHDLTGKEDLFGRTLKMTQVNVVDGLAAAAVLMMGEADECCPLAVLGGTNVRFSSTNDRAELIVPPEEDLYGPLYLPPR